MKSSARLDALSLLGLVVILITFLIAIIGFHPVNFFGYPSDDAVYFSSAQALADGHGYVLPSVPGTPSATKYPVLLPLILSFVWRYNPSFPANLPAAIAVIVAFGCLFIIASFCFLKEQPGLKRYEIVLLTAFCAFHPKVLFYSATLLSDIPFSALALASLTMANRTVRRDAHLAAGAVTGILSGLSILLRVIGVPIAAGIFLYAIRRRAGRQAAIFVAGIAPFFLWAIWASVFKPISGPPAPFSSFGPGWEQTWIYYTNYTGIWKLSLLNFKLMSQMLLSQFLYLISDISGYFISPLFHKNIVEWLIATLLALGIILFGIRAPVLKSGWKAIHLSAVLYVILILFWHFIGWDRFLLPFLPFLAASFYSGSKQLVLRLWAERTKIRHLPSKIIDGVLSAAIFILFAGVAWNFAIGDRSELRAESKRRENAIIEKKEVYAWIMQNVPKDARVISSDDAMLYLYTGRQAMWEIAFLPAGAYDEQVTRHDLNHMMDVAQAIGAEYWVLSDASDSSWKAYEPLVKARLTELSGVLPELFRSSGGQIRVLGLGCVNQPFDQNCRRVVSTLFPSNPAPTEVRPQQPVRKPGSRSVTKMRD